MMILYHSSWLNIFCLYLVIIFMLMSDLLLFFAHLALSMYLSVQTIHLLQRQIGLTTLPSTPVRNHQSSIPVLGVSHFNEGNKMLSHNIPLFCFHSKRSKQSWQRLCWKVCRNGGDHGNSCHCRGSAFAVAADCLDPGLVGQPLKMINITSHGWL